MSMFVFYGGGACGLRGRPLRTRHFADAPFCGAIGSSRYAAPAQYRCVKLRRHCALSIEQFALQLRQHYALRIAVCITHCALQFPFTEDPNNVLFSVKA